MHGRSGYHRAPEPKCEAILAIDAGDEFDRELNRSRVKIMEGGRVTMSYGCPSGHTGVAAASMRKITLAYCAQCFCLQYVACIWDRFTRFPQ
jgi:hypothetical protein